ncbi:hypothetical protein K488DRAFT_72854 [Vararia minispora EC-137]|uniref:Uncharacterized protein n=1 Tax=Vararia minispora EC-137 TaxID=1314806 RepID=A0ACB8QE66_9AGAM|nr:hypothetical protein K488DRAFT_72854 [Vararia minispora EC-137]
MRLDITYPSEEKYVLSDEFRVSVYTVAVHPTNDSVRTVTKAGQAEDEMLAKFVFRTFRLDKVVFRGKERDVGAWLQKKRFSSTRTWTSANERTYSWSPTGVSSLTLKNASGEELGRSHSTSRGLVGKEKHGPYIELGDSDQIFADLDEIVVTWLYLKERERMDRGGAP